MHIYIHTYNCYCCYLLIITCSIIYLLLDLPGISTSFYSKCRSTRSKFRAQIIDNDSGSDTLPLLSSDDEYFPEQLDNQFLTELDDVIGIYMRFFFL